jgi:hypothetical protein
MSRNDRWWTEQRACAAATLKGQNGNSSRTNGSAQEERGTSEAPITIASTPSIDTPETATDARPLDALIHEDDDDFDDDDDDVPGAFAVSRFRPSSIVSTGWDPTAQVNEETLEGGERTNIPDALWQIAEEPVITKRQHTKRFWLVLLITIFAVIIAALVLIIPKVAIRKIFGLTLVQFSIAHRGQR